MSSVPAKRTFTPEIEAAHSAALALCKDTYIDPATGYTVFTSFGLKKRPCCGNACRHCPYDHVNVKPRGGKAKSPE